MKKKTTIAIVIVLVLCSTIFVTHYFFIGSWSSSNINRYIEVTKCIPALPKMEDLGSYSDIKFKYYRKNMLMFFSDAYTLKASYDNENYQKEKDKFLQNYVYQTEPLHDDGGFEKEPSFEMDSYSFQMLSYENYELQSYPHDMVFIGFSDEKNKIAIVSYFDSVLDHIDGSFSEFLEAECGWE